MKKMEELSSGTLVKFLQEMHAGGIVNNTLDEDDNKSVLLQIRSIIPLLREGDHLWPNQGFFLRVSDLSHAIYVCLPQEQDDMVLCDKLHIGQYLFVEKLEAAYPVPMLKGIKPLPGRNPCLGNPKDLIPLHNLEKFLGVSKLESMNEEHVDVIKNPIETEPKSSSNDMIIKENKQREKSPGVSTNEASLDDRMLKIISPKEENNDVINEEKQIEKSRSLNSRGSSNEVVKTMEDSNNNDKVKKKQNEKFQSFSLYRSGSLNDSIGRRTSSIYRHRKSDVETTLNYRTRRIEPECYYKGIRKQKPRNNYKDSDVESTVSATSTFKRKSWNGKEDSRLGEILDPPVVKHEVKPDYACSATVSASSHHSSSDDNSSSITKTITSIAKKSSAIRRKSRIHTIASTSDEENQRETSGSTNDCNSTEIKVSWDLLPSSLVKLGQEVTRQRDIALMAAVEALLDASAAERLLKCLSIYSNILSAKEEEHQHQHHPSLERFFIFENTLEQIKLGFQSPTCDPSNLHPVSEETSLALDRKQNATTWIKSALESDLNPISDHIKTSNIPMSGPNLTKLPINTSHGNIPKIPSTLRRQRSNPDIMHTRIEPEIENQQDWIKGRSLPVTVELADSLENESRTWFLNYVEDYLGWVSNKTWSSGSDGQQAAEIMYKIKKVSDWLDMTCKDKSTLQDSELDACGRVKNKIYEILMKHVERTTMSAIAE